jgi:hypothetical protein
MQKRTSVVLFGVVAIVAILAATEIVAQTPPDCPQADSGVKCVALDGFTVWIEPDEFGSFPIKDGNNYIYNYRVDCEPRQVNFIDITLPISVNPGTYASGKWSNIETSVSETFPPPFPNPDPLLSTYWLFPNGEGDGTYGKDINTYHVLKWKIYKKPTFWFSVKIKNQQLGAMQQSILLKTNIGQRDGLILGPASPFLGQTLSYAPATQVVAIKLGPDDICVGKDPATGCIKTVCDCEGDPPYCYPITPISDVLVDGSSLQWAGGEADGGRCPTVILYTTSSWPQCYTIGSGGNASKVCYCTQDSQCTPALGFTTCYGETPTKPGKCRP